MKTVGRVVASIAGAVRAAMGVSDTPYRCLLLLIALCGCSGIPIQTKNGTVHHLIIGVGIVSTKEQTGVSVEDTRALGLTCGRIGLSAGLIQQHDVEIDPKVATDAVISIKATPFSLTVTNFNPHFSSVNCEQDKGTKGEAR